jgi:hypothetical protein
LTAASFSSSQGWVGLGWVGKAAMSAEKAENEKAGKDGI